MRGALFAVVLSLLAVACGSSSGSGPPLGNGGSGGSVQTGGAGGTGGSSGSAGADAGGDAGPCGELSLWVNGDLDGAAVDGLLGGYRGYSGGGIESLDFLTGGGIVIWDLPLGAKDVNGPGWLSAPVGMALNGAQLLADSVSTTLGNQSPMVFAGLHSLGNCPGTAASGSLQLFLPDLGMNDTITGSLDGAPLDLTVSDGVHSWFSCQGEDRFYAKFGDHGRLFLEGPPGAMAGALTMPGTGSEADTLICVGSGNATQSGQDWTVTVNDLSRASGKWPGQSLNGTLTTTFCQ